MVNLCNVYTFDERNLFRIPRSDMLLQALKVKSQIGFKINIGSNMPMLNFGSLLVSDCYVFRLDKNAFLITRLHLNDFFMTWTSMINNPSSEPDPKLI